MANNELNAVNRGVYISDNLPFLKSLNDGCIDLVCIDPPFAKNETFGKKNAKAQDPLKPPLSKAEKETELVLLRRWGIRNEQQANDAGIDWPETRYKDFWSWKDVHEEWLKDIEDDYPGVHKLIEATQEIHSDGTAAYLCYMAVRLFELRRVLKDTGSLYLHCDHTAGAYLRQLLDAVFGNGENGKPGFRNEIAWCYTGASNTTKWFPRKHDTILFYTKANKSEQTFSRDAVRIPYSESFLGRRRYTDQSKWKGGNARPTSRSESEVDSLYSGGKVVEDWWSDIPILIGNERTGYPTQKPIALAERIIKASCPENGTVLDCFAGCAYVAVAAERLGRNWVACDINPRAWTVFKRQFAKPKLALLTCAEPTQNVQPAMLGNIVTVHGPAELPTRDTPEAEQTPPSFRLPDKPRTFKTPASIIPEEDMKKMLLEMSGWKAWCCGFANRMPDGTIVETTRNFHLDHVNPASKEGTSHQITNRAPLCEHHNIKKSNQRIHLAEYRETIKKNGELLVDDISDLMDLNKAAQRTLEIYAQESWKKNPQGSMLLP